MNNNLKKNNLGFSLNPAGLMIIIIISLLVIPLQVTAASCQVVAKLVTSSGKVEYQSNHSKNWYQLTNKVSLCANGKIRVGANSKVNIRLNNNTIVRLKENSLFKFSPTKKNKFVNLLEGAGHFISRIKNPFEVKTPLINAFIEGTEFLVSINPTQGQVSVLEGKVRTYNQHGVVTLLPGQISVAKVGKAPILRLDMQAQDELNWTIDYPISLFTTKNFKVNRAINLLKIGKSAQAKNILRQSDAKPQPDSVALLALILLSENKRQAALKLINQTPVNNENTILVKSYIYQSLHDLDKASATLNTVSADSSTIKLRQAELALLEGNTSQARRFLAKVKPGTLNKSLYSAFNLLLDAHPKQAISLLKKNQENNKNNPQFWLILGLATIQQGDEEYGIKHLEQAVSLSPASSHYRNYLGRAYLQQGNFDKADAQFSLAKSMDSNDPSIDLHQAISAIGKNEFSDALPYLNLAVKNVNKRAVYRKFGVRAVDQANLLAKQGAIYKALGNNEVATDNVRQAMALAPNSTAAHQLQSDLLTGKQRHQGTRVSERQQALLYSPLYRLPTLPSLADQNLVLLNDAALFTPSLHEYDDLFAKRGVRGNLNLFAAGQNTKSVELGLNLVGNNTVLGVGYLDYETDGFFLNDFREYEIKNVFLQHKFSDKFSMQFEHFEKKHDIGDIFQNWFINPDRFLRETEDTNHNRLGLGLKLNDSWSLYASFAKSNEHTVANSQTITQTTATIFGFDIITDSVAKVIFDSDANAKLASLQLVRLGKKATDFFGLDYGTETRQNKISTNVSGTTTIPLLNAVTPFNIDLTPQIFQEKSRYKNLYWYRNFKLSPKVTINTGLEYSQLKSTVINVKKFYPKFAINWQTNGGWLHNASYHKSMQAPRFMYRSLKPEVFAGTAQNLDNLEGYQNETFKISSLLNKPDYSLYSELQYSKGEAFGNQNNLLITNHHRDYSFKLAFYKSLTSKINMRATLNYTKAQIKFDAINFISTIPEDLETYTASLAFNYRLQKNISLNLITTYVRQNIKLMQLSNTLPVSRIGTIADNDQFFLIDLETKIKLPAKGNNYLFLGVKNATNTHFKYQDNNYRSSVASPFPYARERLFYARLQFEF